MSDLTPRRPQHRPLLWSDDVLAIQEALLAASLPPVYLVGGAVRDACLHRPIKDIDLATPGSAIGVARHLANALAGDLFIMDRERDVARVFLNTASGRLLLDVAGFRGPDLAADLTGRDFTVNAMAVDLHSDLTHLIDPCGGEPDLRQKVLRRCTPDALAHDPIRALRGVRQSVQFGLRIEPATLQDLRAQVARLPETSPERVRDEFFSLLLLDNVTAALRIADAVGVLEVIVPEVGPLHGLAQPAPHVFDAWQHTLVLTEKLAAMLLAISYRRSDSTAAVFDLGMMVMQLDRYRAALNEHFNHTWANDRPHRALLLQAALLHNAGKAATAPHFQGDLAHTLRLAEARAEALRLSQPEKKRLLAILSGYRQVLALADAAPLTQHRFWHGQEEAGVDRCLFALADYAATTGSELEQHAWLRLVERVRGLLAARFDHYAQIVKPPPPVNGHDLMARLAIPPGRILGDILDAIREAQVTGEVVTAAEAYALAQRYLAARPPAAE
ncbi:MAG: hypothetical protein MUE40_13175 [Anaerolineae bacterium]|nr:hypothetical protein [Anaerolineae bacterium]